MDNQERKFRVIKSFQGGAIDNFKTFEVGEIISTSDISGLDDMDMFSYRFNDDITLFKYHLQEITKAEDILSKFVQKLKITEDYCYSEDFWTIFIGEPTGPWGYIPDVKLSVEQYNYLKSLEKENKEE